MLNFTGSSVFGESAAARLCRQTLLSGLEPSPPVSWPPLYRDCTWHPTGTPPASDQTHREQGWGGTLPCHPPSQAAASACRLPSVPAHAPRDLQAALCVDSAEI